MDRIIEKKKWTAKKILSLAAIGLFVLFIIYLLFFKDKSSKLLIDKSKITIAEVRQDKFQEFIPIDGIVQPKKTIYIDAAQGGRVEKIFVEDGANIKAGDLILKLSNADVELSFMERQTQMYEVVDRLQNTKLSVEQTNFARENEIAQLGYDLKMAKDDYDRKKLFIEKDMISKKEYLDSKYDYELKQKKWEIAVRSQKYDSVSAVSQIKRINTSIDMMYKNLEMLHQTIEQLYIKAPVSGQLSNFSVEIGETKNRGQNLGQIDVQDGFKLRASVDERYINRVYKGQEAEFDFADSTYSIEIGKIYTQVSNGAFEVDFFFKSQEPKTLKRGQTLQVRLKFSGITDATIVQRGAFYQYTGGNWVYVLDASETFAYKREVKIGRQNTKFYEVIEGLNPGEKIITSSYETFGNKDKLIFR